MGEAEVFQQLEQKVMRILITVDEDMFQVVGACIAECCFEEQFADFFAPNRRPNLKGTELQSRAG
jgi:hypothetical protein